MLHRTTLRRPTPAPRPRPLRRLRDWLLEDPGDDADRARARRAVVAGLLRAAPPH